MPVTPPFGFIATKSASIQLQTLLKLQNNRDIFDVIRKNIRRLVNKYMDVRFLANEQPRELHAIGTELKKQYPDIFATEESEKRLYFVMRVVYSMHIGRRFRFKLKRKQLSLTPTSRVTRRHKTPISLSTQGMSRSVSQDPARPTSRVTRSQATTISLRKQGMSQSVPQGRSPRSPRTSRATRSHTAAVSLNTQEMSVSQGPSRRLPPTSRVKRSHSATISLSRQGTPQSVPQVPSSPSTVPTSRVTRNQRKNQQSQLDPQEPAVQPKHDSDNLVNIQGMPQSVSLCHMETRPDANLVNVQGMPQSASLYRMDTRPDVTLSLSSQTVHDPNQYRAVYDFLDASVPPMTHLMDAFIDFGCVNADFLRAMSKWRFERISYALDQLSPRGDDGKLSGMEKFVLQNHLRDYFA